MFLNWRGYPVGIALVLLVTLLKILGQPDIIPMPFSPLYVLAIVPVAVYFGLGPAIFTSILSVLALDYFFFTPLYTVSIPSQNEFLSLVIFLFVGIVTSFLSSGLLRKTEEANRLNRELIKTQEEERKRIARELHDDTAPSLAYLSLELDSFISKNPGLSGDAVLLLKKFREKINNTQQDIRRFSHELHPAILDTLGLEAALEAQVAELGSKDKLEIQFQVSGTAGKLPDEVSLALYRIAQESLNNIWKHSRATRAAVNLEYTPRKVLLSVTDNGIGFDPDLPVKSGLGIMSMKERSSLIGARLKLESAVNGGTRVSVEVALPNQ